jgi:hypothetical protein
VVTRSHALSPTDDGMLPVGGRMQILRCSQLVEQERRRKESSISGRVQISRCSAAWRTAREWEKESAKSVLLGVRVFGVKLPSTTNRS